MSTLEPEPSAASLAPWLEAYQKLGRTMRWLPFLMFSQGGGVRSEVVNTDRYGFRWTVLPDGEVASLDSPPKGACGLVIGGSTTFGVGASSDAGTVASAVAAATGRPWLNLGARAHCSTQELLSFLLHADLFPPIDEIVFMSGINDLYLQYAANRFDEQLGAFLYSDQFFAALEKVRYGPLKRARLALSRLGRRQASASFEASMEQREDRRDRTLAILRRNLSHWAALAASRSARVTFALQPTAPWLGKKTSREEQVLFSARERQDPRYEAMVSRALSRENHAWYAEAIEEACRGVGFGFLDLNRALRGAVRDEDWIFTDRAHLTDRGYAACAACIGALLS
jgi:hypothetical protein